MIKSMASLRDSKQYRKFVNDRDLALESILHNYQKRLSDETNRMLTSILQEIQNSYDRLISVPNYYTVIDQKTCIIMHEFIDTAKRIYTELRRTTYVLTISSEHEAINRGFGTNKRLDVSAGDVDKAMASKTDTNFDPLDARLDYSLVRLKNKLMDAVKLGVINQDERKVFLQRVFNQIPKFKAVDKRKTLKKLTEADKKKAPPIEVIFADDSDWADSVKDYFEEYVPKYRSPETVFDVETAGGHKGYDPDVVYGWEIERDMTHDFVVAVRDGMVDAAKKNGIVDFMVIAIIDDRTCENCCGKYGCIDFDGKTTAQVQKMTGGAQVSPPFHFNCRCTLAPYTDDMPELETSNEGDFESWLND